MTTTFKPKPWEEVKDLVAGKESYDYDTIAYDRLQGDGSKKNLAGIVAPKPISQMTIGELNDWQEAEMRSKSRAYGLNIPGRQEELRRQGFRSDPGSTGVGRYQFEKSTLEGTARELYGDNYRNVKFDPDTQEKLASHLYYKSAARGPEALGNTWHALRGIDHSSPSTISQNQIRVAAAKSPESSKAAEIAGIAAAPSLATVAVRTVASALRRDQGGGTASDASDDIGTLGQYRGRSAMFSNSIRSPRNKLLAALETRAERQKQKAEEKRLRAERLAQYRAGRVRAGGKKLAENTIGFKDFRKKIFEQIIMNDEKENQE